jgi:hypothetical protein
VTEHGGTKNVITVEKGTRVASACPGALVTPIVGTGRQGMLVCQNPTSKSRTRGAEPRPGTRTLRVAPLGLTCALASASRCIAPRLCARAGAPGDATEEWICDGGGASGEAKRTDGVAVAVVVVVVRLVAGGGVRDCGRERLPSQLASSEYAEWGIPEKMCVWLCFLRGTCSPTRLRGPTRDP